MFLLCAVGLLETKTAQAQNIMENISASSVTLSRAPMVDGATLTLFNPQNTINSGILCVISLDLGQTQNSIVAMNATPNDSAGTLSLDSGYVLLGVPGPANNHPSDWVFNIPGPLSDLPAPGLDLEQSPSISIPTSLTSSSAISRSSGILNIEGSLILTNTTLPPLHIGSISAVPEPTTFALLVGAGSLAFFRRRR